MTEPFPAYEDWIVSRLGMPLEAEDWEAIKRSSLPKQYELALRVHELKLALAVALFEESIPARAVKALRRMMKRSP